MRAIRPGLVRFVLRASPRQPWACASGFSSSRQQQSRIRMRADSALSDGGGTVVLALDQRCRAAFLTEAQSQRLYRSRLCSSRASPSAHAKSDAPYFRKRTPSPEFWDAAKNSIPYLSSSTRCIALSIFRRRGSILTLSSVSTTLTACRVTPASKANVAWSTSASARPARMRRGEGQTSWAGETLLTMS